MLGCIATFQVFLTEVPPHLPSGSRRQTPSSTTPSLNIRVQIKLVIGIMAAMIFAQPRTPLGSPCLASSFVNLQLVVLPLGRSTSFARCPARCVLSYWRTVYIACTDICVGSARTLYAPFTAATGTELLSNV
jgi:hypothetical protein